MQLAVVTWLVGLGPVLARKSCLPSIAYAVRHKLPRPLGSTFGPWTNPVPGRSFNAEYRSSRQPFSGMTSLSTNHSTSFLASLTSLFLVAQIPRFSPMETTLAPAFPASSAVMSVDPSSPTITSSTIFPWTRTPETHASIVSSAFHAGIITLTFSSIRFLFPFYGAGRLRGKVEDHPVYSGNFIDYPG